MKKKLVLGGIVTVAIIVIGMLIMNYKVDETRGEQKEGVINNAGEKQQGEIKNDLNVFEGAENDTKGLGSEKNWKNYELKDVMTNRIFKIDDFRGKPALLESFAVWCPKCLQQQQEFRALKGLSNLILISLDTDENEDEDRVRGHIQRYGFDWYFAISPSEMTQSLIDEFGIDIINAPSAHVVLICPNGQTKQLRSGVKSAGELKSEIDKC